MIKVGDIVMIGYKGTFRSDFQYKLLTLKKYDVLGSKSRYIISFVCVRHPVECYIGKEYDNYHYSCDELRKVEPEPRKPHRLTKIFK